MSEWPKTDCRKYRLPFSPLFRWKMRMWCWETYQIWTRTFVRNHKAEYCSTDPSILISKDLTAPLEFTLPQVAAIQRSFTVSRSLSAPTLHATTVRVLQNAALCAVVIRSLWRRLVMGIYFTGGRTVSQCRELAMAWGQRTSFRFLAGQMQGIFLSSKTSRLALRLTQTPIQS
jgi:hypothetical protein